MRDRQGTELRVGDRIQIGGSDVGIVVASIDTDEYSADYPKKDWAYLKAGVMVWTEWAGLMHFDQPHEDTILRIAG